jgi:hypothetical protein
MRQCTAAGAPAGQYRDGTGGIVCASYSTERPGSAFSLGKRGEERTRRGCQILHADVIKCSQEGYTRTLCHQREMLDWCEPSGRAGDDLIPLTKCPRRLGPLLGDPALRVKGSGPPADSHSPLYLRARWTWLPVARRPAGGVPDGRVDGQRAPGRTRSGRPRA